MNPFDKLGEVAGRIASLTSIIRTKQDDEERLERNGGIDPAVLHERVESAARHLRMVADDLEALI